MLVEFKAAHRYARMAPRKVRKVIDLIRGQTANAALDTLRNDRHRAARHIEKVLASAVANALQDPRVKASRLVVSKAYVNEGPLLMGRLRFRPGPMGRAMPFRRRTCHIHVVLTDPTVQLGAVDEPEPETRAAATPSAGEAGSAGETSTESAAPQSSTADAGEGDATEEETDSTASESEGEEPRKE